MSEEFDLNRLFSRYRESPLSESHKLRELLQECALFGLARQNFFEVAGFYGGTALRILYGLDRFSEDLDFSLFSPTPNFNLAPYLEGLVKELESMGLSVDISEKRKADPSQIVSAFLKANTLNLQLQIHPKKTVRSIHPEQKIRIKLEIDTDPPAGFNLDTRPVLDPLPFNIVTFKEGDLFAGKLHACLCREWKKRVKGRDWFDFIWFIQRKVAVNLDHLTHRMRQTHHLSQQESMNHALLLEKLSNRIDQIDWRNAKKDVIPFLVEQRQIDLWSADFFHALLDKLRSVEN